MAGSPVRKGSGTKAHRLRTPAEIGRIVPADVVSDVAGELRAFLVENPGNENTGIMLGILAGEG